MWWLVIVVAIVGMIIIARGYATVRKSLQKYGPGQHESWDAQMVERLRSHGYTPFNEYRIDFFLALPDEAACQAARARLETEGFAIDVKPIRSETDLPLSAFNELRMASRTTRADQAGSGAASAGTAAQRSAAEQANLPLSLHASKAMRLIVEDIQGVSRRMSELAAEFHGRYDGWAA